MKFQPIDVFIKPRHGLETKSAIGGIITIIAASAATILFIAQLFWYLMGTTRQSLHMTKSKSIPMLGSSSKNDYDPFQNSLLERKGKIPIKIHVTFPHLQCDQIEVLSNSAVLTSKDYDPKWVPSQTLDIRKPRPSDLLSAGIIGYKHQEHRNKDGTRRKYQEGCTINTVLRLPLVAGQLTITLTRKAWSDSARDMMLHIPQHQQQQLLGGGGADTTTGTASGGSNTFMGLNVSHYIHSIQFGTPFPHSAAQPLESRWHSVNNPISLMSGIASLNLHVKLIPTLYQRSLLLFFQTTPKETYQVSVVDHTIKAEAMMVQGVPYLPGLILSYDITPLAIHHSHNTRDNIFVFLSSLVSIVGGVFVTVGLVTSCLVHSARAAITKKMD